MNRRVFFLFAPLKLFVEMRRYYIYLYDPICTNMKLLFSDIHFTSLLGHRVLASPPSQAVWSGVLICSRQHIPLSFAEIGCIMAQPLASSMSCQEQLWTHFSQMKPLLWLIDFPCFCFLSLANVEVMKTPRAGIVHKDMAVVLQPLLSHSNWVAADAVDVGLYTLDILYICVYCNHSRKFSSIPTTWSIDVQVDQLMFSLS